MLICVFEKARTRFYRSCIWTGICFVLHKNVIMQSTILCLEIDHNILCLELNVVCSIKYRIGLKYSYNRMKMAACFLFIALKCGFCTEIAITCHEFFMFASVLLWLHPFLHPVYYSLWNKTISFVRSAKLYYFLCCVSLSWVPYAHLQSCYSDCTSFWSDRDLLRKAQCCCHKGLSLWLKIIFGAHYNITF